MQYGFSFDSGRCIFCKACEVACLQWKNIPADTIKLRKVIEVTTGLFPDVKRHFLSISCRHCAEAMCIECCPTQAIIRQENGIVFVLQDKCSGCRDCIEACPFDIPQFDDAGLMQKCDMCLDRIERSQMPICAATCPTKALQWRAILG